MRLIRKSKLVLLSSPIVVLGSAVTAQANNIGYVDVYVDHSALNEAISLAESSGITVTQDPTIILTGDADQTVVNTRTAQQSYADQVTDINRQVQQYVQALNVYNAEVQRNEADADEANALMSALRTNLAANNQTVLAQTKAYTSNSDLQQDVAQIQAAVAAGDKFQQLQQAIVVAQAQRDAMVDFQTQANQGHITLVKQTVSVSNEGEVRTRVQEMQQQYQRLQQFIQQNQNGGGTTTAKPSFTLYEFTVADSVATAASTPVTVYHYTPKEPTTVKPVKPAVSYHLYDVRSTPSVDQDTLNKDNEEIVPIGTSDKLTMVMPDQTVSMSTNNQPIPAGRFDKFHDLTVMVTIPSGVDFKPETQQYNQEDWTMTYNAATRLVTFKATDMHLLRMNQNATVNNGQIGGTIDTQFTYASPNVTFSLPYQPNVYVVQAKTMVNHEYLAVGDPVHIKVVDPAEPTKTNGANLDGKLVFPGTVNDYRVVWDFDQYRGVNVDRDMQSKGLILVDDYPEEAVDVKGPITITDLSGKVLYTAELSNDKLSAVFRNAQGQEVDLTAEITETAPEGLEGTSGKIIVIKYTGVDTAFYKEHVEKGQSLVVRMPMTTRVIDMTPDKRGGAYGGVSYTNKAWQIDYGKEAKSNDVTNNVVKIDPRKDAVLTFSNLASLDIEKNPQAEVTVNVPFFYRLSGSTIPTNMSEPLRYYQITDEFASVDTYTGRYFVESGAQIHFKEGTALHRRHNGSLHANSDLTKYTTQTIARNVSSTLNMEQDTRVTRVSIVFDQDFLDQIDFDRTTWQVDTFLETNRLRDVDGVKNIFVEMINAVDFGSNEIITNSKPSIETRIDSLEDKQKQQEEINKQQEETNKATASSLAIIIRDLATRATRDEVNDLKQAVEDKFVAFKANLTAVVEHQIKIAEQVDKNTNGIKDNATRIDKIEAIVIPQTRITQVTIYEPSVVSDTQAVAHVVSTGVPSEAIIGVTQVGGRFVVSFDENKANTTGSQALPLVERDGQKVTIRNAATKEDALKALNKFGIETSELASIDIKDGVWTAILAPKVDVTKVTSAMGAAIKGLLSDTGVVTPPVTPNPAPTVTQGTGAYKLTGTHSKFTATWQLDEATKTNFYNSFKSNDLTLTIQDGKGDVLFTKPVKSIEEFSTIDVTLSREAVQDDVLTFVLASATERKAFTQYQIK